MRRPSRAKRPAGTVTGKRMKYDPRLDSWRALAALAVIALHWQGCLLCGWIGIQFFFVLSGFLITALLLSGKEKTDSFPDYIKVFFSRRALRLFPVYFGFLAGTLILSLVLGYAGTIRHLLHDAPSLVFYVFNFQPVWHWPMERPYNHLWTLSVEWQFYLAWPFIVWWVSRRDLFRVAVALLLFGPLFRGVSVLYLASTGKDSAFLAHFFYFNTFNHLDAFAMGALLVHEPFRKACQSRVLLWTVGGLAVAGGLYILIRGAAGGIMEQIGFRSLGYPFQMAAYHQYLWGYSLLNLLSAVAIAHTLAGASWTRFTNWPRLQYLGKISYGIYVFHAPVVMVGMEWIGLQKFQLHSFGPVKILAGLMVCMAIPILAAHLSYTYGESWFLKKRPRRMADRPEAGVTRIPPRPDAEVP